MTEPKPWRIVGESDDPLPMWPLPEPVVVGMVIEAIATPQFQDALARWFAEDVVPHRPVYDRNPDTARRNPHS